jgi:hypothetical protein
MRIYALALLAALHAQAAGTLLTHSGTSLAAVVSGQRDEYAASRVTGELRKYAATDAAPQAAKVLIYVGTLSSNPALARAAVELGWKADIEKLPPEGYLIRSGTHDGKSVIVLAGGDRTGAIYAASDFKNFYLHPTGDDVETGMLDYTEIPRMKYRWFWNWDVRTNWDLLDHDNVYVPTHDLPKTDSVRAWFKRSEAFVNNMKLVID